MTAPRAPTPPLTDETALLPDPETMTLDQVAAHWNRVFVAYYAGQVSVDTYVKGSYRYSTAQAIMRNTRRYEREARRAKPWWRRWWP